MFTGTIMGVGVVFAVRFDCCSQEEVLSQSLLG